MEKGINLSKTTHFILSDGTKIPYADFIAAFQEFSIAESNNAEKSIVFRRDFKILEEKGYIKRKDYKSKPIVNDC
jgi:hypothetical protein